MNMTTTTPPSAWRRDPELPFQKLEEETIVVDPRRREVHLLNDTAAHVWELLATSRSIDDLVEALGEVYDAPADEVQPAVAELLRAFEDKGLLLPA
jgi:Coenzyme PQQ synthesis protein D (PqqD)